MKKTKGQKVKKVAASIAARNTAFNAMTPAEKRVAICIDVLQQVALGKYNPAVGVYVRGPGQLNQMTLTSSSCPICDVCQQGALVCSALRLGNVFDINIERLTSDSYEGDFYLEGLAPALRKWFGARQAVLMECAFECTAIAPSANNYHEIRYPDAAGAECQSAKIFGERFDSAEDRMCAIMANVIGNRGEFVP